MIGFIVGVALGCIILSLVSALAHIGEDLQDMTAMWSQEAAANILLRKELDRLNERAQGYFNELDRKEGVG